LNRSDNYTYNVCISD